MAPLVTKIDAHGDRCATGFLGLLSFLLYGTNLRVPKSEGGRLMPPSWFLRFWTCPAGPG